MKRTTRAVVVGALVVGIFSITGCSISIGSAQQAPDSPVWQSAAPSAVPPAAASPSAASPSAVSPSAASPSAPSPSGAAAGATYLAIVAPANTATFALDTAVFGSTADLTSDSLAAIVAASAASIQALDDHLRTVAWPRTAEPDVTTLAARNDVLVVLLQRFESNLQSPTSSADFNTVVQALASDNSPYAIDRGLATDAATRVRADLGLPPPSAPQVTLND